MQTNIILGCWVSHRGLLRGGGTYEGWQQRKKRSWLSAFKRYWVWIRHISLTPALAFSMTLGRSLSHWWPPSHLERGLVPPALTGLQKELLAGLSEIAQVETPGVSTLCLPATTFRLGSHLTLYMINKQGEIAHYPTCTRRAKNALLHLPGSPLIMFFFCNGHWAV